jgi:Cytochrome c554 and c-prime
MNRIDFRAWSSVILFALALAYAGCSTNPTAPAPAPAAKSTETGPKDASPAPADHAASASRSNPETLLNSLGKPAAVLLISGEQDGYMEPCGCSADQEGGLIRRYDLVERMHKRNWPTTLVDLGSLMKDPSGARGGFDQAKYKFDFAVKALKLLKYNALGLSAEDLKIGVAEALGSFDNSLGDTTKITVANVEPDEVYKRFIKPSLVVTAGPVKLGVTAVIDPETLKKLNDPDKDVLLPKQKDPDAVLPAVLADLEAKSDYQVLMVQGPPEMAQRLAKAFPGFDVVVATSQFDDVLNREPEMLNDGKTMLLSVGKKGKNVGLLGIYPSESPHLRFLLVTLTKQFNDPATPMKSLIQDEYRSMLKATNTVANFTRRDYVNGAPGATFVGAQTCKQCHAETFAFWSKTGHAKAFESLKHDPKPNTVYDAECVSCHTTGFEYNSGFKSEAATPFLAGNQCENCHGPGSKHVEKPDDEMFKKLITIKAERAKSGGLCDGCHDAENSPKFDFAAYWDKIEHNGLDDYGDPKVHEGPKAKPTQPIKKTP